MPFKSKKQKKTIDAAAHNPEFAKKIGIKVTDAKKMSKHGKGQTKFEEAKDTVEKDEKGNVKSWKHEGDWEKAKNKEGRGKVTNLSDKARRKTEKLSKAEKEMAESFEKAMEATVTQGPNKGKQWSPKTPGPTNPSYPKNGIDPKSGVPSPPDGATAPPKDYKPSKRADAGDLDDEPAVAETAYSAKAGRAGKDLGKKGKNFEKIAKGAGGGKKDKAIAGKVLKDIRAKHLKESIEYLSQLIQEAKKGKKVDQNNDGKNDFEDVKIARLKAAAKGKSKKVDETKKEKEPEGLYSKKRFETDSQRVARLAKEKRQAEKKKKEEKVDESKAKCTCEDSGKSKCAVHGKKKDAYMESLLQKLQNQLNG